MKALLINPADKSVTEITVNEGIKDIYKAIECDCFSCPVTFENGDTMYCDDEGLFKEQEGGIMMIDWAYPILGKILLVGSDIKTGKSCDVKTTIATLKKSLGWVSKANAERYRAQFN